MNKKYLFLILLVILVGTVSAEPLDICAGPTKVLYIVHDDCPEQSAAYSAYLEQTLVDMGFEVDLIGNNFLDEVDFDEYAFMLLDDHFYENYDEIPVNDFPAVILNSHNMEDWNWVNYISTYTMNINLRIENIDDDHIVMEDISQFPTVYDAYIYNDGYNTYLPVYYLSRFVKAPGLHTLATTYTPAYLLDNGDATLALAEPGDQLLNGDVSNVRSCWFGFTEKDYWTNAAETMFEQCVAWVSLGGDADEDGVRDDCDNCPYNYNPDQSDIDGDKVGDVCDNCPSTSNTDQEDNDEDGIGNVCDICPDDSGNDADQDGFCYPDDCVDTDDTIYPGADETVCNGIDNDCDIDLDEDYEEVSCGQGECSGMTSCEFGEILCRDNGADQAGSDCGGCCLCEDNNDPKETYDETQDLDCSDFNLAEIATCTNDPDNNPMTWDSAEGFVSECSAINTCTQGTYDYTHTCDTDQCGAQCEIDGDCESYCEADVYYDAGTCDNACGCEYESEDCSQYDGWYDTGELQWVNTDQCNEKEQYEQEYRDYTCGIGGCDYTVTDHQWLDSGSTRYEEAGTTCDDGLFCTVGDVCTLGVCGGETRDCSAEDDQCNLGVCDESQDVCVPEPVADGTACDDSLFCNVGETCQSGVCTGGLLRDCSGNDLDSVDECNYVPDGVPVTRDTYEGFTSVCVEEQDICTTSQEDITSECDLTCGAQCEIDGDCESYCEADVYYDAGTCDNACGCEYESEDCSQYDGWYDTGELQWVNTDQCNEKEQYEQEYRDYTCGIGGCGYTVTDHQWLDSGSTRYEEAGTTCDDGLFCTVGDVCTQGVCGGEIVDCSANDISEVDTCFNDPDGIDFTYDTRESFTSVCVEDTEGYVCTTGDETVTSECDTDQCGAQCEIDGDCESYCEADVYYDAGTCDNACGCEYESEDCSQYDGWYDTGELQWVNTDQCNEKEQYEQEYRDYTCGIGGCDYTVTDHQWLDSGSTRYEEAGTTCDDGLFCTVGDVCTLGVCGGETRDCSAEDDQCNLGVCDEQSDVCLPEPVADGTACNDNLYCNVGETCQSGVCTGGLLRDCSGNDIPGVDQCDYSPDDIDFTRDTYEGFTSVCSEELDICTEGEEQITSECDLTCGAECEADGDCESYCEADVYYDAGTCDNACGCEYESEDCSQYDGWYDTGELQWVNTDQCNEKEQYEQEYRDYTCGIGGCDYTVTDHQWLDTGNNQYEEDGTVCDDGLYCTENDICTAGVCGGETVDCSANDISGVNTCFNDPDDIDFTYDTRESFTSVCVEEAQGYICTTGDETVASECDIDQCGAECEADNDCGSYCEADLFYGATGCSDACGCEYDEPLDCNGLDGFYYPGEERWVNHPEDQCKLMKQVIRETRDYTCDAANESGCSYVVTDTRWVDRPSFVENKDDGTSCDADELYCTVNDVCMEGVCEPGDAPDCTANDISEVDTCFNDPDGIDFTYDTRESFTSVCVEDTEGYVCTTGDETVTSECDTDQCGAQCEIDGDCESYCEADVYYDAGTCDNACGCEYESEDCSQYDGWYDTGELQWVNTDQCNEKEQYEQEYRDYTCGIGGCDYTVTDRQWLDTGVQNNEPDGTICEDGLYCTENDVCTSGVCGGQIVDCSANDITEVGTCTNDPDGNPVTWDSRASFTSVCVEEAEGYTCTEGDPSVDSECDKDTCGAQCEVDAHCGDFCADGVFHSAGTCSDACGCVYETEDCNSYDGWYESVQTRWVEDEICTEKEQAKREYRDYSCGFDGCIYEITDEDWIDTGETRNKPQGTTCDDGLFCTVSDICSEGVCGGSPRDCSAGGDQCNTGVCDENLDLCIGEPVPDGTACDDGLYCNVEETCQSGLCQGGQERDCSANDLDPVDQCNYEPDGIDVTRDTFEGFISECVEEDDSCTVGNELITSYCDLTCGAECADGNQDNTDGCLNTCVKAGCGDGYVWEGKEECDDANTDNTDACLNKCVLPTCGDGYVWEGVEECDDGALNGEPLHCSLDCDGITDPVCGNEVLEQGEECDDGNLDSNDGCSSQCIVEFCGDNIVQPGIGEECEFDSQCDDQDYRTEDVCSSSCGCENNIICEDECLPSEADVCMAEEIWECRNDFDTDPCYEWGPKFDCSTLDSCHVYQLEEPICLSCGTDCCIYEGIEYREYSCLGGDCAYTVLPLIDADSDMKDDRCDDCVDLDNDGICDHEDTCPGVYNPTNVDSDNDGVGNACDNDRDNDGYDAGDDCNDWDPEINPGMPEIQGDGKDNDCDPETPDREQKIRSQDLQLGTKILNEDTALEDDELMVAVYVRNRGSKTVKDLKIKGILLDEYISDYTTMPTLKDGDTNRVILYIPFDGRIMPDAYYLRTTLYVENVKKSKYSQVLIH